MTAEESETANWRPLLNTAAFCAGVVCLALPAGTFLAIVLTRTDVAGRRAAAAVLLFLLFLPLYVHLTGWEAAFGKLGWLTSITRVPLLVGMRAVIFLHGMAAIPWVALVVAVGLRLVRRTDEEVALLDASGPRVMALIVLPQLAPYLWAASLLAAISAASEMTVTNIYLVEPGDYTLAEQVYMTLQSQPLAAAVRQSLWSIGATTILVAGGVLTVRFLAPLRGRSAEDRLEPLTYPLGSWKWPTTLLVWLLLAALVGVPLASMAYKSGTLVIWDHDVPLQTWSAAKCATLPWVSLWRVGGDLRSTVVISAAAATLDVALAIGMYFVTRHKRWRDGLLLAAAGIAWAIPGPVVGLGIIGFFQLDVPGFDWLYNRTDLPAILAQGVRAAPIVVLVVMHSLERFPRSVLEAAQLDGASPWSTLCRVILPQRWMAVLTAWTVGLAIAAGDLAWSILVLRPGSDTLQRRLFADIHAGADDRVAGTCLAMSALYAAGAAVILVAARRSLTKRDAIPDRRS